MISTAWLLDGRPVSGAGGRLPIRHGVGRFANKFVRSFIHYSFTSKAPDVKFFPKQLYALLQQTHEPTPPRAFSDARASYGHGLSASPEARWLSPESLAKAGNGNYRAFIIDKAQLPHPENLIGSKRLYPPRRDSSMAGWFSGAGGRLLPIRYGVGGFATKFIHSFIGFKCLITGTLAAVGINTRGNSRENMSTRIHTGPFASPRSLRN